MRSPCFQPGFVPQQEGLAGAVAYMTFSLSGHPFTAQHAGDVEASGGGLAVDRPGPRADNCLGKREQRDMSFSCQAGERNPSGGWLGMKECSVAQALQAPATMTMTMTAAAKGVTQLAFACLRQGLQTKLRSMAPSL